MPECYKCGKNKDVTALETVDGKCICHGCLYEGNDPYQIYPIGFVNNKLKRGQRFGLRGSKQDGSKVVLFESQKPFLYKLEDEKWIVIVFYFHEQRSIRSVFSRGIDGKKVGIFASRTPDRLSRIGVSTVELVRIENTTLYVKGLDAIDGTPILDIKLGAKSRW